MRHNRLGRFWKVWSDDYLRNLPPTVQRFQKRGQLKEGSVVLIHDDVNLPRLRRGGQGTVIKLYPTRDGVVIKLYPARDGVVIKLYPARDGVVIKLYPARDGLVRTVDVKTKRAVYTRSVQRLHDLELVGDLGPTDSVPTHIENDQSATDAVVCDSGREQVVLETADKKVVIRYGRVVRKRIL